MTKEDIAAIKENRMKLKSVFNPLETAFLFSNEKTLDKMMLLFKKIKKLFVETNEQNFRFSKMDKNDKTCNLPSLCNDELDLIASISDFFFLINLYILKYDPKPINKKHLQGFYFKYKNHYFVAEQNMGFSVKTYKITYVSPIAGRKPIEIHPYC